MTRISITVPIALNQQLQQEAMRMQTSVSDLIRTIVDKHLVKQNEIRIRKTYQALAQMVGQGSSEETDISQRVDEIVYGLQEHTSKDENVK